MIVLCRWATQKIAKLSIDSPRQFSTMEIRSSVVSGPSSVFTSADTIVPDAGLVLDDNRCRNPRNHAAEDLVLGGVIVLWIRVSRPRAGVR
jgi:hypothetical protein